MAASCSSDLPSLRGAQMKPISPLIARKPTNIHASVWNPVAVSHGTKKLKMPSAMRTTANIHPCAVLRSRVGNISALHSRQQDYPPNPPQPSRSLLREEHVSTGRPRAEAYIQKKNKNNII